MILQKTEITEIRKQLVAMTSDIEKSMHEHLQADHRDGEIERGGHDRGEEANQALEIGMSMEQTSRSAYNLQLAREALDKLESDEFGFCTDCREPINVPRLLANPIAKRCLDCQEKREDVQDERDQSPSL